MAKSKNNVVTYGLSGKIGDLLVFRQRDGQTIVSKIPQQSGKASAKQKAQRKRFQQAVIYAKTAVDSSETGDLYKAAAKKGKTPINVAVADFFNAPDIEHVDLSEYTGNAGDRIIVTASDDFMVKSVKIKIINDSGVLEDGEAAQAAGLQWVYTATQENSSMESTKIVISVSDLPGNVTEEELIL
jgi:hypothetical protein